MKNQLKKVLGILLIASIGGVGGATFYKMTDKHNTLVEGPSWKTNYHLTNLTPRPPDAAMDFTHAAELTVHAVVHVKTFYPRQQYDPFGLSNPLEDFFWGNGGNRRQQQAPEPEASGSGVIISDDGYIVTNNHVVDNASKIEITLNDKRTYTAKVIGTDPSTDLALIRIDEKDLPFITYGNSDDLKVGEWVLAVGNPFNLTSTVTAGIVSAKSRNINLLNTQYPIEAFIQTDAAVNPGNSGGALVNTSGQLVGINAAIASSTGNYMGYSFAIPVNIVKKVVNDLHEFGVVQRGVIGVQIADIDTKLAEQKGIKNLRGVYVDRIVPGGSAEDAGIEKGDVITKVGETEVNSSSELQEQVGRYRPGDKIKVVLIRDDKEKTVSVVLKNRKNTTDIVKNDQSEVISLLGADFESLGDADQAKLKIGGGVKIKKLGAGKLRSAGIREGFIVTKIDHNPIRNTDELNAALQNKRGGVLIEGLYPNGMSAYYAFGI